MLYLTQFWFLDIERITNMTVFIFCSSDEKKLIQKQMAFMLARQQIYLELDENMDDYDDLVEIMSNTHLNNNFLSLARRYGTSFKAYMYI